MIEFLEKLLELINDIRNKNQISCDDILLKKAFLNSFSHTPCNKSCIEHIEFGESKDREHGPSSVWGLKLKNKNYLISDILWKLENEEIYNILKKKFPDISFEEIEAILRINTTTMSALEYEVIHKK